MEERVARYINMAPLKKPDQRKNFYKNLQNFIKYDQKL